MGLAIGAVGFAVLTALGTALAPRFSLSVALLGATLTAALAAPGVYLLWVRPALARALHLTQTVVQAMDEGVVVISASGRLIDFNPAALHILQLTEEQLRGRTPLAAGWRVIHEDGSALAPSEFPSAIALRTGNPVRAIVGVVFPDQTTRWLRVYAAPFAGKVVAIFSDATELREAHAEAEATTERLKMAIRAVKFGVWDWNLKSGQLVWDPFMYSLFDVDPKTFAGDYDAFQRTLHPEDAPRVRAELEAAFAARLPEFETQFRVMTQAATIKTIAAKSYCLYDAQGAIERCIGCNWDITERHRLERENAQNQALLEQIVNTTPDWIFIKGRDHRYLKANAAYASALGKRPEEMVGKTDLELGFPAEYVIGNPEKGIAGFWTADQAVIDSGRTLVVDHDPAVIDGREHVFHTIKAPLRDSSGRVYAVLGFARDITQLKATEASLFQASKMASLGEMSAGIAHEINNPLTVIVGNASQMLRQLDAAGAEGPIDRAKLRTQGERMIRTGERIAKIVRGLRTFSRNSESDPFVRHSLRALIQESLDLCAERFKHHGIEIRQGQIPDVQTRIRPGQISQVLLNLLNNSHDAIQAQPERWMAIEARESAPGEVEISVTDSGPGIPAAIANRIMAPFFTTKPAGQGTGLGLSIAASIVAEHGGRLWLDRSSPKTRFAFTLPIAKD